MSPEIISNEALIWSLGHAGYDISRSLQRLRDPKVQAALAPSLPEGWSWAQSIAALEAAEKAIDVTLITMSLEVETHDPR
jgi:hypothetical protein